MYLIILVVLGHPANTPPAFPDPRASWSHGLQLPAWPKRL